MITVNNLQKTYDDGFCALKGIHLTIHPGEIFALLGPNGAGKSTLISTICGLTKISQGSVTIGGYDNVTDFKNARHLIGLVPQELLVDAFITVETTVKFSRSLFGHKPNPSLIEKILKDLSLWDKRNSPIMSLSGGMKRRVMIAKALAHEPKVLFLDEPTAGVDVELRKDMWKLVQQLKDDGVTIILTTHYIEEAEEVADRVGVIRDGELLIVDEKQNLMNKLGSRELILELSENLETLPEAFNKYDFKKNGNTLTFTYNNKGTTNPIQNLIEDLALSKISYNDLQTRQSSLEEIFVELVRNHES